MNPSNPFGSPQSGAFQAPSNATKTGLFPSFGQQTSGIRPQSVGFVPPSAFGQPSVLSQPSSTIFGQPSTQPTSMPATSQAPAFGQPSLGMSSTGFGSSSAPAFGQTGEPDKGSGFGQTPSFAQPSAFGQPPGFSQQASGFVKQPPAFGQQPSGFAASQMAPVPTAALGQPQPLSFGQSVFGQPSSTSLPASVFGTAPSVTQSSGFGSSNYSFKPANEAVFKPILNVSPEPAHPQTTSMSSSPFVSGGSQTASSIINSSGTTATGFSGATSGQLGFSFSQPGAAPSISAQTNNTLATSAPANTLQFTFSQPAAPSSSNTKGSTTEPTTPSTFSFVANAHQPQAKSPFGGANVGLPPEFKARAETGTEEKGRSVFARLGKGTKRKEDPKVPGEVPEKPAAGGEEEEEEEDDVPAVADAPRHPSKRPLMRSRCPPPGLFGRALSGLRREVTKETEPQASTWEEPESENVHDPGGDVAPTPPTVQPLTREGLDKAEQSGETEQ